MNVHGGKGGGDKSLYSIKYSGNISDIYYQAMGAIPIFFFFLRGGGWVLEIFDGTPNFKKVIYVKKFIALGSEIILH